MNIMTGAAAPPTGVDSGLHALCGIAAYYRVAADPVQIRRELVLHDRAADQRIWSARRSSSA